MMNGKIALLLGQAEESYQQEFIRGVMKEAFRHDYSVYVFSMYIKYQNNTEREVGDANIFRLFNPRLFDAVIIMSDTIQTPGVAEEIEERLKAEENCPPVLCVDKESKYFPTLWTEGYESVYALTSHMIETHRLRDLAFLTGRKNHPHSVRREAAFRDAMEAHGLQIRENRVFYGDFWYTSGSRCAEALLRDTGALPEALLSANDPMAIGAAVAFEKAGIRIPEDIAIVGYGTTTEGQDSPKSLTSCYIPAEDYGASAMRNILQLLKHEKIKPLNPHVRLYIGESCGCQNTILPKIFHRETWESPASEDGFYSIHNTMEEDLLKSEDPEEFLERVYEHLHHIRNYERFDLFLNEEWLSPGEKAFPKEGYSPNIIHAIHYYQEHPASGGLGMKDTFPVEDILPDPDPSRAKGYFFTPLFMEDISFGYAMISYGCEARSYEEVYRLWVNTLSRGLESLRRKMLCQVLERKYTALSAQKYASSSQQLQETVKLTKEEIADRDAVEKLLDENLFTYHFQPIISTADGSIYSYEALMRSNGERMVSPLTILKYADQMKRLSDVERATMLNVLGILDEHPEKFTGKKVFINSIPGHSAPPEDKVRVRELIEKHPETVVIELTEQAELSDRDLKTIRQEFQTLGAGLAVDDYGTGYSNVSNLLRYMPNVVKIDRALLSDIQDSTQKQHFFRDIVEFCHANDILALAEGVETSEELREVILLGADLIQGFYTARPSAEIVQSIDENLKAEIVRYRQEMLNGSGNEEYIAGRINRISVSQLLREHKTTVVVGDKNATFRDITIVGTPGEVHRMHIEVLEGYDGRITLENVAISSYRKRPCIRMAENSSVTLRLVGANRMVDSGIQVPENASLSVEGEGSLYIRVDGLGGFGIGNQLDRSHGSIAFYQDGEIRLDLNGNRVVGIGSGLGGPLQINRGKYDIYINGDECVGIGSIDGESRLIMHDSDVQVDVAAMQGVCVGSFNGNCIMEVWSSLVKCSIAGKRVSAVGTLKGDCTKVDASETGLILTVNADQAVGIGSLDGSTELMMGNATFRLNGSGNEVYCYGGLSEDTTVSMTNSDVSIDLRSASGAISKAPKEKIEYIYGRARIILNENVIR
ncbi:MAG: EAL domain-containing protein [Eubacterium sp.]|nr:EAL domain-containing protein [Eubacterium sp.]